MIFLPQKEDLINRPGAQKTELCTALFPTDILWNSSTNNYFMRSSWWWWCHYIINSYGNSKVWDVWAWAMRKIFQPKRYKVVPGHKHGGTRWRGGINPLTSTSKLYGVIFMVAPCINSIKYFIIQLMHSIIWIAGLLKTH